MKDPLVINSGGHLVPRFNWISINAARQMIDSFKLSASFVMASEEDLLAIQKWSEENMP